MNGYSFNPPPGWPAPPPGWVPPEGWHPDPSWPPAPEGWEFWLPVADGSPAAPPAAPATAPTPAPSPPAPTPAAPAVAPAAPPAPTPTAGAAGSSASDLDRARSEADSLRAQVARLETQLAAASAGPTEVVELSDEAVLQEVGIYRYHHPLENAAEFKAQLADLSERIKETIKAGDAVLASDMFTYNNSLAKGRRMTADLSKLMLRAYNAEADTAVRSLRAGNVLTAKKRLEATVAAVAKLGSMMEMRINPDYHGLRVEELELTSDYLMKLQEEKEAAKEERERLREERKAEEELAAERARLDKERAHYANALAALQAGGDQKGLEDLQATLAEIDAAIEQNDYRQANIRAGYVYVISNRGAMGDHVVKIGMTRRLEPMDRIRELGDASVPFPFDVHALFFADDAVALEGDLHRAFADRRVNRVNERKEFFFATPAEVREVLAGKVPNLLEFADEPEATQYLQSRKYWPTSDT